MYTIVLGISLINRFERTRWQTSVARERQLRRERIELSQTIHDTTAQTAYMIGLGIHRARELAGGSNQELKAALDATLELAMSAYGDAGHQASAMDRGCAWLRGEAGELRRAAGHDGGVDGRVGLRLFGWSARKARARRHSAIG